MKYPIYRKRRERLDQLYRLYCSPLSPLARSQYERLANLARRLNENGDREAYFRYQNLAKREINLIKPYEDWLFNYAYFAIINPRDELEILIKEIGQGTFLTQTSPVAYREKFGRAIASWLRGKGYETFLERQNNDSFNLYANIDEDEFDMIQRLENFQDFCDHLWREGVNPKTILLN